MPSEGTVVVMGLPGAGKTTFLAALWHQLESAEIATAFTTTKLQPEREYLNKIREMWLGFEEIPRTTVGVERSVLLHLLHVRTRASFDLFIPDVAGETFAAQWFGRQIPLSYVEQLQSSFGLLLFVHCQQLTQVHRLISQSVSASPAGVIPAAWEPKMAPTQVQLVDLLQTALGVFERTRTMRVAIVVSAWDEIEERITPTSWLEKKMPLLDQFCRANVEALRSQVYGVSAIGGSLADKEALALMPSPSSRVRVYLGSDTLGDLTLPLEFLTVGEREL